MPEADYDEFGMLSQNADEIGLVLDREPVVTRRSFTVAPGQEVSAIAWGEAEPELVLLHGGGQNAHTWDTLVLAVGRPALAIDLPGHGHSGRRPDRDYGPWRNAEAVAPVIEQAAPRAAAVIGDVSPQAQDSLRTMSRADRGAVALVAGPPVYDSFEAMAEAAVAASPRRPRSAVERGVRHNSVRLPDGRWTWRYDLFGERSAGLSDFTPLWDDVAAITAPVMLVRGGDSKFVTDDDVAEFRRRMPGLRSEVVPDSGHAVQSDQPLALARLIEEFIFG